MGDYSLEDLVRLSRYSARGIRHYIQLGLLARPKLAGPATRYTRETLGRLAAIRVWRENDGIAVRRVKRLLRALPPEDVEAWANQLDPGEGKEVVPFLPRTVIAPSPPPALSRKGLVVAEGWVRVPLVRGLDLVLRDGAGEEVVQMAREIQGRYGGTT